MSLIRSRLVVLALALLIWQVAGVCATPVALCSINAARAAAGQDVACTCDHTDGGVCQMHKTAKKHADAPSPQTRWCAGCGDEADLMILTMLAASGGLPGSRQGVITPAVTSERLFFAALMLRDAVCRPVSPPPRG